MTQGNILSRIFLIGCGEGGGATGRGFRTAGHEVTAVDTSQARVEEPRLLGLDARGELDLSGEPDAFVYTHGFLGFAAGIGADVALKRAVVQTDDRTLRVGREAVA